MTEPLVVIGDSLLDRDVDGTVTRICPDAPAPVFDVAGTRSRPGGAALAASLAAALHGPVRLVTAVAADEGSRELLALLEDGGVEVVVLPACGAVPEKVRLRADGQTLLRLDRGGLTVSPDPPGKVIGAALDGAGAVLVSDYGRGVAALPPVLEALGGGRRRIVWDPHPKGPPPVPGCRIFTPNAAEALGRWGAGDPGAPTGTDSWAALARAASTARTETFADSVAVTWGDRGALLDTGDGAPRLLPAPVAGQGDACGAGDCFAAAAAAALAGGAVASEAVAAAVERASRFVAAGGAARYPGSLPGPAGAPLRAGASRPPGLSFQADERTRPDKVAETRAGGGVVVAAGGCFDVLHAGHVAMLQAARRLGDCLVVCLNSDRSVRRLKGPGRPVNPQADRAATLAALGCVDAVAVFDEDTPETVLRRLRPDIWVKGGDYDGRLLPEASVLQEWGGEVAVLPYLADRSTSRILSRLSAPEG
jgi:D-beta-D-heptose 7-phosphate kinase/D-beta-D-heptose 1-phosphate adenosyltransferase